MFISLVSFWCRCRLFILTTIAFFLFYKILNHIFIYKSMFNLNIIYSTLSLLIDLRWNLIIILFTYIIVTFYYRLRYRFLWVFIILKGAVKPLNILYLTNSITINNALLNGIFYLHSFNLYVVYTLVIILFIALRTIWADYFNVFNTKLLNTPNYLELTIRFYYRKTLTWVLIFTTLALVLGAYWAYQELEWGGWWNWDLIELLNLFIFLFVLNLIHYNRIPSLVTYTLNSTLMCVAVVLVMVTIRFNVVQSVHNFISTPLNNQGFTYILITCLILITTYLCILVVPHILKVGSKIFKPHNNRNLSILNSYSLYMLLLLVTFLLYSVLVVYNYKKYVTYYKYFVLTLFSLFPFFIITTINTTQFICLSVLGFKALLCLFAYDNFSKNKNVTLLHFLIFYIIIFFFFTVTEVLYFSVPYIESGYRNPTIAYDITNNIFKKLNYLEPQNYVKKYFFLNDFSAFSLDNYFYKSIRANNFNFNYFNSYYWFYFTKGVVSAYYNLAVGKLFYSLLLFSTWVTAYHLKVWVMYKHNYY